MLNSYKSTVRVCFLSYIVQAIVNNFVPLLFVMFQDSYGIPLAKLTVLITVNFSLQFVVDALSATFVDKIGYRASAVMAELFSATGFICLAVLPDVFADPFTGLMIAVVIYALGGGLLEVLISPIVEACPTDNKEKTMSLLHSFYCWGHVAVVLVSTVFFLIFGIKNWKIMALIWAVVPAVTAVLFTKVPIRPLIEGEEKGLTYKQLFSNKIFWLMMLLMICAGAAEQAVSQWASAFAEQGLGVSKTLGDLCGPMFFAITMGLTRLFFGKCGERINLTRFMLISSVLCVVSYIMIAVIPNAVLGLIGCGICGLSVGILWPGLVSTTSAAIKNGGTKLFSFMLLCGDLGCMSGPSFVGLIAGTTTGGLKLGILCAVGFPILMIIGLLLFTKMSGKQSAE